MGEAIGLQHLGEIDHELADHEGAYRHFDESLAIARTIMHVEVESECERMWGEIALEEGDRLTARSRFRRALEVASGAGDKRGEATALWFLGKTDVLEGKTDSARIRLRAALLVFHAFEMRAELLGCLEDYATFERSIGSVEQAVRHYATVTIGRERLGLARPPRNEQRLRAEIEEVRNSLGDAAFEAAWSEGQRCEIEESIRRALTSG